MSRRSAIAILCVALVAEGSLAVVGSRPTPSPDNGSSPVVVIRGAEATFTSGELARGEEVRCEGGQLMRVPGRMTEIGNGEMSVFMSGDGRVTVFCRSTSGPRL